MSMEDDDRIKMLGMSNEQVIELADFCNNYPSLQLNYEMDELIESGDTVTLTVNLEREGEEQRVFAPYFPKAKEEWWWVLIGDNKQNKLFANKRV